MSQGMTWGSRPCAALALLGVACIENQFQPKQDSTVVVAQDSAVEDTGENVQEDTAPTAEDDPCDGVDNDADGVIDEGFPDADVDGIADCVDDGCAVVPAAADLTADECACSGTGSGAGDPWAADHVWAYRDPITASCTEAAVADLDGDGTAELVCAGEGLAVVDATTGTEVWRTDYPACGHFPAVAVADADADGDIDILVGDSSTGLIHSYGGDGSNQWTSSAAIASTLDGTGMGWLGVADLAGDCLPDVVTAIGSVDLATGATGDQWAPSAGTHRSANGLALGDVDGDGIQDVFANWRRYSDSSLVWESRRSATFVTMVIPLLIQADADDDGEVAWVSDLGLVIDDADGTELLVSSPPAPDRGLALGCAGDLDGDGREDIVGQGAFFVWAWTLDGSILWSQPAPDDTQAYTGCAVFDFDGDGSDEVVFEGETDVAILDGATGLALWDDPQHQSGTWGETPAIVDVDGDGRAELVATSESYYPQPTTGSADLYSSSDGSWPAGTTIWASPNWSGTEIRPDGSVPRYPARPWLQYGIWRGQPNNPVFGADLKVTITDACTEDCSTGAAYIAVQVSNLGSEGAPADTPLAFYTLDELGNRTLVESWELGELLWPGHAAAGKEFTLPVSSVLHGVVAVVGQSGAGTACAVPDCDESNNEATWAPDCPEQ